MTDFEFRDRDGVTWRIAWRSSGADARVVGGSDADRTTSPEGFEFTCEALTFMAPWPAYTDPRALRTEVIQRMIDRALGD